MTAHAELLTGAAGCRYAELSEPDIAESEQLLLRAFGPNLEAAKAASRPLIALGVPCMPGDLI